MFILEFSNYEEISKIYQINYTFSLKVEIQHLLKNKSISRCETVGKEL